MNAIVEQAIVSRRAVLQEKYTRAGDALADPPKPVTFPAQTLLPDLRIPIADLLSPLKYVVPQPLLEDDEDFLQPQIRKLGDATWIDIAPGQFIELGPVADRDWTVPFEIAVSFLIEALTPETPTEYEMRYIYWAGGTNDGISDRTLYTIDLTYPYKVKSPASDRTPGAPTWPADLGPTVPIDEAYLEGKSGILVKPATSPTYHETDIYKFYWGPAPDPDRDPPVFEGALNTLREALIPADVFKNGDEGANQLIYRATDLPGNVGKRSNFSQRNVVFLPDPDPDTVLPPVLPLANGESGDDLIDLADTQFDARGVQIDVMVPTPNAPGDTIVAYLGGKPVGPEQRVGAEVKLTFFASYDLVKEVYGNTDGTVIINVSYKMFRGVREIATSNVDIKFDISFIGPDPILIGLEAPSLTTTSGSIDEILESDFGDNGIQIRIKIFDAPPTEEGWLIDVFYNDVKIGSPIPLTTGEEGTTLSVPLPWATVLAQQSGTKILRYTLYTPTGVNPTQSRTKDIVVEEFPIEMAAPEVLKLAGPLKRIGCTTLNFPSELDPGDGTARRNLLVRVLKNQYTVDGETITLKYYAYTTDPAVPIPDTDAEATFEISGTYPDDGALISIGDYMEDFRPAHAANARITYTISRGGAGNNPTPESLAAVHRLDLDNSEGQFCEEVHPLP
ncbi:hypothetical protein HTX81_01020 [Pseudomonas lini]|uniref:hypothetical protein n=1 Tax=Pseudomonas lini TaxID=163011 RepID=UPI0005796945|nr:hypothetical protein [Pseudomonas lini]NSX07157.1 hypothetical protein [Pseudomonas lini]